MSRIPAHTIESAPEHSGKSWERLTEAFAPLWVR